MHVYSSTFMTTSTSFYADGVHIRKSESKGNAKNDFYCKKSRCWLSYLDIFWWNSGFL